MMQELRRQADEQPDIIKLLWKKQLSQQSVTIFRHYVTRGTSP